MYISPDRQKAMRELRNWAVDSSSPRGVTAQAVSRAALRARGLEILPERKQGMNDFIKGVYRCAHLDWGLETDPQSLLVLCRQLFRRPYGRPLEESSMIIVGKVESE